MSNLNIASPVAEKLLEALRERVSDDSLSLELLLSLSFFNYYEAHPL
jgi:hypothetical protein